MARNEIRELAHRKTARRLQEKPIAPFVILDPFVPKIPQDRALVQYEESASTQANKKAGSEKAATGRKNTMKTVLSWITRRIEQVRQAQQHKEAGEVHD